MDIPRKMRLHAPCEIEAPLHRRPEHGDLLDPHHDYSPRTSSTSSSAVLRTGRIRGNPDIRISAQTLFAARSSSRVVRFCPGDSSITQNRITPIWKNHSTA